MTTFPLTEIVRADFADRLRPATWRPRGALARRMTGLALRAHEAVMGRRTRAIAGELEASQWWSAERIASMQLGKLNRLLAHARRNCSFYGSRVSAEAGEKEGQSLASGRASAPAVLRRQGGCGEAAPPYGAADLALLNELSALPFVTRETLRRHAREMCWQDMPRKRLVDHSRGTSDEPVVYFWDRARQAWDRANRLRGHGWHGFRPGDHELHLWPVDPPRDWRGRGMAAVRNARDFVLRESQIDCLKTASADRIKLAGAWWRFDPVRVTAFPSALVEFLRTATVSRQASGVSSLQTVFLTGEVVHPWQWRAIQSALGVRCAENYGVQEVGAIAFECERGRWHTCAESVIVEFIREGRPAKTGELAEVVVTGLESFAMPMIRYRTGDLVRVAESTCDCGRGLPVMPPVQGRIGDHLMTAAGEWISPVRVVEALSSALEPGRFQVGQMADGSIDLAILRGEQKSASAFDQAVATLIRLVGHAVPVSIRQVDRLALSEFGKCRLVRSRLASRFER